MEYAQLVYIRELEKALQRYLLKNKRGRNSQKIEEIRKEKQVYLNKHIIEKSNLYQAEKTMAMSYFYDANEWDIALENADLLEFLDEDFNDNDYRKLKNGYVQRIERYFKK